ncbi:MAG: hypothetical protein IGS03_10915 [Candidatus Sericytochromatia bacterium]|nr:hypothetical protein [Candidatus Sericytochromatia bacterium]
MAMLECVDLKRKGREGVEAKMANLLYHSTQIAFFVGAAFLLMYIFKKNSPEISGAGQNKPDLR